MRISDWSSDVCSSDLAARDYAFAADVRLVVERRVAGRAVIPGGNHAHERTGDLFLGHAHRVIIAALRGALRTDRDMAARQFRLVKAGRSHLLILEIGRANV